MATISKIDKKFLLTQQTSTNPVDRALTPVVKTNELIDEVNDHSDRLDDHETRLDDLEDGDITTSSISLDDGLVSDLAIKIGADQNNGVYGISDTQLGIAVEGVLVGGANTVGLFTDVISEQTTNSGVTIDQVLLKDGTITYSASDIYSGTPQTLTGAGAVNTTAYATLLITTGANALTLAAGTTGQKKIITMKTDGGDGTLTPTGLRGGTTITFNDVGDTVELMYIDSAWIILSNFGCTVA